VSEKGGTSAPRTQELRGDCRKLHNEELNYLFSYLDRLTIKVIRSRWIRWSGHAERRGARKILLKCWLKRLKARDPSEDLGVD
jgi:hypothetical protein